MLLPHRAAIGTAQPHNPARHRPTHKHAACSAHACWPQSEQQQIPPPLYTPSCTRHLLDYTKTGQSDSTPSSSLRSLDQAEAATVTQQCSPATAEKKRRSGRGPGHPGWPFRQYDQPTSLVGVGPAHSCLAVQATWSTSLLCREGTSGPLPSAPTSSAASAARTPSWVCTNTHLRGRTS